jgi:hypothetical protein
LLSTAATLCQYITLPPPISQFFTWIALGDVDLHFSAKLVRKTNAAEDEAT